MDTPRSVATLAVATLLALAACGDDGPAAGTPTAPTTAGETTGTSASPSATSTPGTEAPATTDTPAATDAPATTIDLGAELDGHTFLSTTVEGYELVEGSQVQLVFDSDTLGATAGCNQLSSTWSLEGDVLVVPDMAMTQMACTPAALMDQDTWLAAVLTSGPTVTFADDALTLTAPGAVVTLVDREVADPDRPLEGTTWNVESLISGDAVSSLPAGGRVPTMVFKGGTVTVDTGCNTGTGSYELGEGEITFGPIATTRAACTDPAASEAEQTVLATLTGTATYEIEADVLTLRNGADGLAARAADDADAAAELEGVTWTLDSIVENDTATNADTVTAVPPLDRPATLMFEDGTVSVDTACNIGSGGYEVSGDEITFDAITTTLIFCEGPAGEVEATMLEILTGTVGFTIDDGVLTLMSGDQGLMFVAG